MKRMLLLLLLFAAGLALAQSRRSTPSEAQAMAKQAIAFLKANGKNKALDEFNNPNGRFTKGDLYILAYTLDGTCLANGGNTKIVGQNMMDMKDADGKYFVRERLRIAKTKGKGWQMYKWTNPVTKAIEDKALYIELVGDLVIGCGAYKK